MTSPRQRPFANRTKRFSGSVSDNIIPPVPRFRTRGITGWRRGSTLPGRPDFVFPRCKLAVFVDGCFWHGCPLHATWPRQNAAFWRRKILANRCRDRAVNRLLKKAGWRVLRIWEHALTKRQAVRTMARITRGIRIPT